MNKLIYISLIIFALVSFSACGGDGEKEVVLTLEPEKGDNVTNEQIIGTYVRSGAIVMGDGDLGIDKVTENNLTFIFKDDNVFEEFNPRTLERKQYEWSYNDGVIYFENSVHGKVSGWFEDSLLKFKAKTNGDGEIGIYTFRKEIKRTDDEITHSATDSIFGYRFGSTMEDVKPDVIRSNEIAFSFSSYYIEDEPGTVFRFKKDSLISVGKYYSPDIEWFTFMKDAFIRDLNALNPPPEVKHTINYDNFKHACFINPDSTQWSYNHLDILVYNDYFSFNRHNENIKGNYLVIEYQKGQK